MSFHPWSALLPEMRECVRRQCDPLAEAELAKTCTEEATQRFRYYETTFSGPRTYGSYYKGLVRHGSDAQLVDLLVSMLPPRGVPAPGLAFEESIIYMRKALKCKRDGIVLRVLQWRFGYRGCPKFLATRILLDFNEFRTASLFVRYVVTADDFANLWCCISAYWFVRQTRDLRTLNGWKQSSYELSCWAIRSNDMDLMLALDEHFTPGARLMAKYGTQVLLNAATTAGYVPDHAGYFYESRVPMATVQWAFAHGHVPTWTVDDDEDEGDEFTNDLRLARTCIGFSDVRITIWLAGQLKLDENSFRLLWTTVCEKECGTCFQTSRSAIGFIEHFGFGWSAALLLCAWEQDDLAALRWYLTRPTRFIPPDDSLCFDEQPDTMAWLRAKGWLGARPDGKVCFLHAITHEPLPRMVFE
jgi:hypothetical protein